MKNKILTHLKNGDYVSGEEISNILNVSRTAVWKNIKKLRDGGYNIESSSKKGYRLVNAPDILTQGEIKPYLKTKYIGSKIMYFDEIDSTNEKMSSIAENEDEGLVITANLQTKGRGRMRRQWINPKGETIAMSILLKPSIETFMAPAITQIAAISALEGLKNTTNLDFRIKWPNDIILNGKKVCGILTEMDGEIDRINYIIVGIGINVNQESIEDEISHKATSLRIELGERVKRSEIIGNILNSFEKNYEVFKKNGIKPFINFLRENSALIKREVVVKNSFSEIIGTVVDIDEDGYLVLEENNGKRQSIVSGDVSIRGKNSYIPS